jgi:hypothetical protein
MYKRTYIFLDTEYCFAAAVRQGQVPNYKSITELFNEKYPDCIKVAYLVGLKEKKRSVANFLTKMGVDFVHIIDIVRSSKTQLVAATLALDVAQLIHSGEASHFVFLTADDYMIPIINFLNTKDIQPDIYYFPLIKSENIETPNLLCTLHSLTNFCFMFPK